MPTVTSVSLTDLARAMRVWKACPRLGPIHIELITCLEVACEKDQDHFIATAAWLFSEFETYMLEAIAVARHLEVLRSWDDLTVEV